MLAIPSLSMAQVKDINTKALTSSPVVSSYPSYSRTTNRSSDAHFLRYGAWTYFTAGTPRYGTELYRTNGTTTTRLTDLNTGPNSSSPCGLTILAGKLYFRAFTPKTGYELFVYDPATSKTRLFADFRKGAASSYPSWFARLANGKIVCSANSGNGYEPHVSNGTVAGTMQLRNIYTGTTSSIPSYLLSTGNGGLVFFSARSSTYGTELYKTNGTAAGTLLVKNIQSGSGSSSPRYFTRVGTTSVMFQAYSSATGTEGWVSNGTFSGTKVIDDRAGSGSGVTSYYTSVVLNGRLLYAGYSALTGTELFSSGATLASTVLVKNISFLSGSTTIYERIRVGSVAYIALRTSTGKYEIWRTNGTSSGTVRFATSPGSFPRYMFYSGGRLYWSANVSGRGYELCYSNGTTSGTGYRDIQAGSGSSYPYYGTEVKTGRAMFRAFTTGNGYEPRFVTGLSISTLNLANFSGSITQNDRVHSITELFGKVLFSATDGTNGSELWYSGGTSASSSSPAGMTRVGKNLFFSANLSGRGRELCVSNGSSIKIYDVYPGTTSSSPSGFAELGNGNVVFSARGTKGYELYIYNGTTVTLLKDIYAGTGSSYPQGMTSWNGRVYFSAYTPANGRELWVTSGTSGSTFLLKNIATDTRSVQSSSPRDFAPQRIHKCAHLLHGLHDDLAHEHVAQHGIELGHNAVLQLQLRRSSGLHDTCRQPQPLLPGQLDARLHATPPRSGQGDRLHTCHQQQRPRLPLQLHQRPQSFLCRRWRRLVWSQKEHHHRSAAVQDERSRCDGDRDRRGAWQGHPPYHRPRPRQEHEDLGKDLDSDTNQRPHHRRTMELTFHGVRRLLGLPQSGDDACPRSLRQLQLGPQRHRAQLSEPQGKKAVLQNWGLNATTFPAGWNLSKGVHLTMGS